MASCVFVSFAGYPYTPSSLCPDNGLGVLAAILRAAGHDVRVLDFGTVDTMRRLYPPELSQRAAPIVMELASDPSRPSPSLVQELAKLDAELEAVQAKVTQELAREIAVEIKSLSPAAVGFKLWNGDGFTGSVAIAEEVRKALPGVPVIAGGPQATWAGNVIFRYTDAFDAVVTGEAEDKIVQLVEQAASRRRIDPSAGVSTGEDVPAAPTASVDLGETPVALYDPDVYPAMAGDQKLKMLVLDDSRGCPFNCAFCMHSYESGRTLRTRPAARIADDIEQLMSSTGVRAFRFAGSSTPGRLMGELAAEISRRGIDVAYTSFAHFRTTEPDHYHRMHASGLKSLFFGLETGSPELLRRACGKAVQLEDVRRAVLLAKEAGIRTVCSMIVPMPFETEETLAESLRLLLELRPDSVPIQFPGLLPGTRWFDEAQSFGFAMDREHYIEQHLDYKFKMLFPPAFWKAPGYTVNGMSFREFTAITARFAGQLEAEGILTGVPDEMMLMADLAGIAPRQFRDMARLWCSTGQADALQQFVASYNRAATV